MIATAQNIPPSPDDLRQVMLGLGLAMLLSALDQTIVATALPTIGAELGDFERLPWIVTAYLVAATTVTPLYGKLADIHGRRVMLLVGVAIFLVGSVACALAPSMTLLAVARAFQGLGGGGLISLAQTVVADLVLPRERGKYQTYFSAVFVTSSVAGPALGGFFAQYLHWSLIFWINVPLGALAFFMTNARLARLPEQRHPHRLDWLGAIWLALAASLLLLALGRSETPGGAPGLSLQAVAPFAASTLCWTLFALRTRRVEEPFIPLSVLTNSIARAATLASAFGLGAFVGLSVVMPLYFEGALGLTASQSGLALIPLMIATVIGATVSGRTMAVVENYKRLPLAALALATLAAVGLALGVGRLPLLALNALLATVSFGVGAILPVATVSVQNAVPTRDLGAATATMQFFRQLACALIVALLGSLVIGVAGADPQRLAGAFTGVFWVVAACTALAFGFLARMEQRPFRTGGHKRGEV
jgi:EmrB/QacA subfamily drug resistance transporter